MIEDFEILGFDTPEVTDVHFEKTNVLSPLELSEYSKQVYKKNDEYYNPFSEEYFVILNKDASERYSFAIGLKIDSVAKISVILNKNYVNIAYWDVFPNVIKNVPISHITLHPDSPFKHKLKVFFTKLVRKILFIK